MSSENDIVLKVENLSKVYRLGEVGTGTISHDLNRWFARIRGKEDPFSKVGSINDRTQAAKKGEYVNALSDINFEVKKGEVLGIIGKNGAGKSTLLKVISRITAPTTGSIKAKGRIASLLEVGTGMHPEMTGRENVYLNGTILGMTKREIDAKFEEIMDFAGCTKYADTPVKRYSSGMKVRLGFAVAAFLEPEILIVDEVLAVGDAEFQKKAIGKMQDISAGGGRTVLFVSHNMGSVKTLCTEVLVINNGKIAFLGHTDDGIETYLSEGKEIKSKGEVLFSEDYFKNQYLDLEGITVLSLEGNPNSNFDMYEDFDIRIQFTKHSTNNDIDINLQIVDDFGNVVFTTSSLNSKNKKITSKVGKNIWTSQIRNTPLNQGIYSINILVLNHKKLVSTYDNVISFNILPPKKDFGRNMKKGKGFFKPLLIWKDSSEFFEKK